MKINPHQYIVLENSVMFSKTINYVIKTKKIVNTLDSFRRKQNQFHKNIDLAIHKWQQCRRKKSSPIEKDVNYFKGCN